MMYVASCPLRISLFGGSSDNPYFVDKFNINDNIESIRIKLRNHLHKMMKTNLKFIDGFENFYKKIA